MRTRWLLSLIVVLGVLMVVGPAAADDSFFDYPDGSVSEAYNLGGGDHAFVFYDYAGDDDIFVHPVDFFAELLLVSVSGFVGYSLWLDFEGFNGPFLQYGVYTCQGTVFGCDFGLRRGTLFL